MVDVVIPVKKQGRHEDLRFTLRSLHKNFSYDRLYIAGHKPRWLVNVEQVERDQSRHSYRANAFLNIQKAVNRKDIGESIVISHDDIVFLRPIAQIPYEHGRRLKDQRWSQQWPYTQEILKKHGVRYGYSWEHHIPALVEKDKIRYILGLIRREYPLHYDKVQWRSVYYNYFKIEGEHTNDIKVLGEPVLREGQQFLSTEDHFFKLAKPLLERMFPEPSIYEK